MKLSRELTLQADLLDDALLASSAPRGSAAADEELRYFGESADLMRKAARHLATIGLLLVLAVLPLHGQALRFISDVLIAGDCAVTTKAVTLPHQVENNPLLGMHPTPARVVTVCGACASGGRAAISCGPTRCGVAHGAART